MSSDNDIALRQVAALERIADALEKLAGVTSLDVEAAGPPLMTHKVPGRGEVSPGLPAPGWIAVPTPYNLTMHVAYAKPGDNGPVMVSCCSATSFSGFDVERAMPIAQVRPAERCGQQSCRRKWEWLTNTDGSEST